MCERKSRLSIILEHAVQDFDGQSSRKVTTDLTDLLNALITSKGRLSLQQRVFKEY